MNEEELIQRQNAMVEEFAQLFWENCKVFATLPNLMEHNLGPADWAALGAGMLGNVIGKVMLRVTELSTIDFTQKKLENTQEGLSDGFDAD